MFRDGFDYYNEFVQFVNKETNGDRKKLVGYGMNVFK